jgi:hypothetical protein
MLASLKNHPFSIEAFFDYSLVFTFAFPKEELSGLIPECLQLDTLNNKWAFLAVTLVQTKGLRPKGFPKFLGNDFFLVGYRIFVRYTNNAGKNLRGLYILKSQTNKKTMEYLGNFFTRYKYETIDIRQSKNQNELKISSVKANFSLHVETGDEDTSLPDRSPFADWKEARRFAGPLPFTFTYDPSTKKVLIIEGKRENWAPQPLKVISCNMPPVNSLMLSTRILANAFIIKNVPYWWKKGKVERWNA